MSLTAGVLILAIVVIRALALNRLPKSTFLLLWGVALVRLLLPFSFPSNLISIPNLIGGLLRRVPVPPVTGGKPPIGALSIELSAALPLPEAPAVQTAPATLLWFFGFLVLALVFTAIAFRDHWELRTASPVTDDFCAQWLMEHQLARRLVILQSDRIATPIAIGLFRPRILLPAQMKRDDTVLLYVLTHEYYHIKRFDLLWKTLLVAALCLHWFNPMVWFMFLLVNRDLEISCDELVLRHFGAEARINYAYSLINMAEQRKSFHPLYNGFSKNAAEERITAIMKYKKTSILALSLTVLMVTCAFSVFAQTPEPPEPQAPETRIEAPVPAQDDSLLWPVDSCKTVTAGFGKSPLSGVNLDFITISGENAKDAAICAVADGKIQKAGTDVANGNYILIDHENGLQTQYAFCAQLNVKEGDTVKKGDQIATLGRTGRATGYCLKFSVYKDGEARDPLSYFPSTAR